MAQLLTNQSRIPLVCLLRELDHMKINGLIGPIENEALWQVRIISLKEQARFGIGKLL